MSKTKKVSAKLAMRAGGGKDHNFLASSVNPIKNYIFGILTSRAIDWHIVESILRGLGGGGHDKILGGSPVTGPLSQNIIYFGILSSSPVDKHPCWVI